MAWGRLNRTEIEAFKATWPCHGLPDALNFLAFEYAGNGDLVDVVAKARNGRVLDTHAFDGPAMLALAQDAQRKTLEPFPVVFRMEGGRTRLCGNVVAFFPYGPANRGRLVCYYATNPTRVDIVKKTKKHVYVKNVITWTVYKVHRSRLTYPDPRGQTGRVMAALERGEKVTPENLYHV